MAKHSVEPWKQSGTLIWAPDAKAVIARVSELRTTGHVEFTVPGISSPDLEEIYANAARTVACVNAMAKIESPEELRAALEMAAANWASGTATEAVAELGDILQAAGLV